MNRIVMAIAVMLIAAAVIAGAWAIAGMLGQLP